MSRRSAVCKQTSPNRRTPVAHSSLIVAIHLMNEAKCAKDLDAEARCELLRRAIGLLVRGGRGDRSRAAVPATRKPEKLEALLEELLDHPSQRLAVYGTLAPGRENHQVIARIHGGWKRGWARGILGRIGPYPAFQWRSRGKRVPVQVLSSPRLPDHWGRLDRFEGAAYRRILAPVTIAGGTVLVANIYEGVQIA